MTDRHDTRIYETDTKTPTTERVTAFRVQCNCGYLSPPVVTVHDAVVAAREHVKRQQKGQNHHGGKLE